MCGTPHDETRKQKELNMKSTVTTFAELILLATAGYAQQKNRPSPAIADAAIASHITIPDAQVLKPYKHVDLSYMGDAAIPFPFAAPALRNRTLGDVHGYVDLSYMGDAAIPFPFAAPALRNRTFGDTN